MNQDTGEMRNHGVIEVLDDIKYKNIIAKHWHQIDGNMIETTRYKTKRSNSEIDLYHVEYDKINNANNANNINSAEFRFTSSKIIAKQKQHIGNDRELYTAIMAGKSLGLIQGMKLLNKD
jgi:tetrahydromethanopterin S-methyltransferase subunit F